MLEDDTYRASSQYRHWSFTTAQLQETRTKTNQFAVERVQAAFQRVHSNGNHENENDKPPIDTLTVDEELAIIRWGCGMIIKIAETMEFPPPQHIIATAIQYLRRFYLTNSPMTYHPKQIMVCAFYLALKAEHWYVAIGKFVSQLSNVSEDDVRAPEFLLMQGLRFTLDVRHPMRGLEGGIAEIRASADQINCLTGQNSEKIKKRCEAAYYNARQLLKGAAQMTDAYFLYTPAQIWLAALHVADQELARDFIDTTFDRLAGHDDVKVRIQSTVESCAQLLKDYKSPDDDKAVRQELARINKKLKKCQDPEKTDIVGVARAKAAEKRDNGIEGSDAEAEKKLKKRRLEKERLEKDGDVFGPDLKNVSR
ncbi:hypothetical protein BT93_L5691 [Corymbia citriodora subsp. variegata]|uniref:Cyclin C-terminal domain-containing protein n=1 Tax=Corymbia citriodora subsp. variegata TaxID=360336 RepID=A0A8T0CEX7_CORYI|nr:hypothetical protein BT93_L5691 [Corymbia citriodora subsp. variegata]